MDGWGHGQIEAADAIANARTPFIDKLYNQYPNSELITCGELVGLPKGQMGNSEVGHLNLGAGRIVYQELERINAAIRSKELFKNETLLKAVAYAKENHRPFHLIGLVSDGGVHAHIEHLIALCHFCNDQGLDQLFIHVFTDGRDTDPESGLHFIEQLEKALEGTTAKIATVTGRFYAMDRDKRWERVKLAYDNLVHGNGEKASSAKDAIKTSYAQGITDEFIKPITIVDAQENAIGNIKEGDAVLCFNFRTDRCREITEVLTQKDMPEQDMKALHLHYCTMTEYDKTFKKVHVLFTNDNLKNTLGEVLAAHNKKQLRMAETEKYPHVTFFFSGGREQVYEGESRIMKPSPKDVLTYDLKPEMSAYELTDALLPELEKSEFDFVCLNYANTDMVGHTGVWEAAMKAAETVDECVGKIVTAALKKGYAIFLTADHGNSDLLRNEDGSPNTAHTLNPVPLFFISNENGKSIRNGKLADIAPTILTYMNIPIPEEMTGDVLFD
jgi:2,3-bisphosphoglycerate-independent phosphoglycerate mutase